MVQYSRKGNTCYYLQAVVNRTDLTVGCVFFFSCPLVLHSFYDTGDYPSKLIRLVSVPPMRFMM